MGESQQETYANIVACDYEFDEEFFSQTSELAKDFIRRLFVREQRRRASVDECLQHPWIQVWKDIKKHLFSLKQLVLIFLQPKSDVDLKTRKDKEINIDNFKNFHARRRWKHSMKVVALCNKLSRSKQSLKAGEEPVAQPETVVSNNTTGKTAEVRFVQKNIQFLSGSAQFRVVYFKSGTICIRVVSIYNGKER